MGRGRGKNLVVSELCCRPVVIRPPMGGPEGENSHTEGLPPEMLYLQVRVQIIKVPEGRVKPPLVTWVPTTRSKSN